MRVVLHTSFLLLTCAHLVHASGGSISSPTTAAFVSASARRAVRKDVTIRPQMSSLSEPDVDNKFSNVIPAATDDTVDLLRSELKSRLLKAADDFKTMKARDDAITQTAEVVDQEANTAADKKQRGYVFRLAKRIVQKIAGKKKTASKEKNITESKGILSSDSFRQMKLEVGTAGDQVIEIAEQLALLNPTPIPTLGFKNYGGAPPNESKLAGRWKLRFTTAADASFPESKKRGVATTSQEIDAEKGTLTNVVDFERGKLKGFRVVVEGEPTSATNIGLSFKAVEILRKSRFPRLFGQLTVRLPTRLIRWLASRKKAKEEKSKGPYLTLRYLDHDLRMHQSDSGNWFIQTRLE